MAAAIAAQRSSANCLNAPIAHEACWRAALCNLSADSVSMSIRPLDGIVAPEVAHVQMRHGGYDLTYCKHYACHYNKDDPAAGYGRLGSCTVTRTHISKRLILFTTHTTSMPRATMLQMSRRQFLKVTASTLAGSSLALMGFSPDPALAEVRQYKLSRTTETRNTCTYCAVGCG